MKNTLLVAFLLVLSTSINGQLSVDFESIFIEQDSFLNGSDGSGGFQIEHVFLPNDYNTEFLSWSGWALTNDTDNVTPGFLNQYSSSSGAGFDNSENYATTFVLGESHINISTGSPIDYKVNGFYVNNNTYAYLSMRDGDAFAKKFGGETGDDPDYFLLTIKGFENGIEKSDSINFYLADFRFEDNSQDYIVKDWSYVDVSSFGKTDSLSFSLSSTDIGAFGMNTPAYFCLDQIEFDINSSVDPSDFKTELLVFPNPSHGVINFNSPNRFDKIIITDAFGRFKKVVHSINNQIDISELISGTYIIEFWIGQEKVVNRVVKL